MSDPRPGWDEYFLRIAWVVASRSTCLRRRVGAVIVRERYMVSTGYNGAPTGVPHCAEVGCLRERLGIPSGERHEMCRGSHGEVNALCQAAAMGAAARKLASDLRARVQSVPPPKAPAPAAPEKK